MEWTGKNLAEDLAKTLQSQNCMAWTNIPLGSVMYGVQVADVLAINKSFAHPLFRIYEIKVSRSDYISDVQRDKFSGYFKSAHQVYFAVPSGLIQVTDLPTNGVGLIVRNENGWHVIKAARRTDYKPDVEMLLKLLMKGYEEHWQRHRSETRREEDIKKYTNLEAAYYDYGVRVSREIAQTQRFVEEAGELATQIGKIMKKDYKNLPDAVRELSKDVNMLMRQKKHVRLALPLANLAIRLFDGEIFWGNPADELQKLAEQARKEFKQK